MSRKDAAVTADRETGQRARSASRMFTDALNNMRDVFRDDALYLAMLRSVEGWIIGQRSWLQAVASQKEKVAGANPGERTDAGLPASGVVSLPVVEAGLAANSEQPEFPEFPG